MPLLLLQDALVELTDNEMEGGPMVNTSTSMLSPMWESRAISVYVPGHKLLSIGVLLLLLLLQLYVYGVEPPARVTAAMPLQAEHDVALIALKDVMWNWEFAFIANSENKSIIPVIFVFMMTCINLSCFLLVANRPFEASFDTPIRLAEWKGWVGCEYFYPGGCVPIIYNRISNAANPAPL